MAPMTNAERQARWREKRDALARQAADPPGIIDRLEALAPDTLAGMTPVQLERLQRAANRVWRAALKERERKAAAR